jgi:hypothetical protein
MLVVPNLRYAEFDQWKYDRKLKENTCRDHDFPYLSLKLKHPSDDSPATKITTFCSWVVK